VIGEECLDVGVWSEILAELMLPVKAALYMKSKHSS
jgi:hypothetical protein